MKATPEMRAAFKAAYAQGSIWTDRLDCAIDAMLKVAPTQGADARLAELEAENEALRHDIERHIANHAADLSADARPVATMDDMRMLIQRLAHSLRKASPDNALSDQAMDYLKRMGLVGTPLRDVATRDAAPSDVQARLDWLREYHCSPLSDEEIDKAIAASAPREKT